MVFCEQGFKVLLEMMKVEKNKEKLKEVMKKYRHSMGLLLLPTQWNLEIRPDTVKYSPTLSLHSYHLVHIHELSQEVVEM